VQRQLQLRIEAQGKYLQNIIEEQQKLGGVLQASEDKQKPSNSPSTSQDAPASSHKKARVGQLDPSAIVAPTVPLPESKPSLIAQWDRDLYGEAGAGLGLDLPSDELRDSGVGSFEQQQQRSAGTASRVLELSS